VSWLLDTNVVSAWSRPSPDSSVVEWFRSVELLDLHISVVSIAELRFGAALMPAGRRRRELTGWIDTSLSEWFEDRVVGIDAETAEVWARLAAAAKKGRVWTRGRWTFSSAPALFDTVRRSSPET
jgi:predicted nucleic acid-binding protein